MKPFEISNLCSWRRLQIYTQPSPIPNTLRERESGRGDGTEEAPEAAARRPRPRLIATYPAAGESGAEAGTGEEAAGGGGIGEAAAGAEDGEVRVVRTSTCKLLPAVVAAPSAKADARLQPSPSVKLVSHLRVLVLLFVLCGHGWGFPLFCY